MTRAQKRKVRNVLGRLKEHWEIFIFIYLALCFLQSVYMDGRVEVLKTSFEKPPVSVSCYEKRINRNTEYRSIVVECGGYFDILVAERGVEMSSGLCFYFGSWQVEGVSYGNPETNTWGHPVCFKPWPF